MENKTSDHKSNEDTSTKSTSIFKKNGNEITFKTPDPLTMIVAVLVVIAGIQVFQTQQLLSAISNGTTQTTTQSGSSALPSQVGGCG